MKGRRVTTTAPRTPWEPKDELRKARKEADLDQEDLALLVGVTTKTISRWENGHSEPTISQWRAIAQVTGASWLLSADNAPCDNVGPVIVPKRQDMIPGFQLPPTEAQPALALTA